MLVILLVRWCLRHNRRNDRIVLRCPIRRRFVSNDQIRAIRRSHRWRSICIAITATARSIERWTMWIWPMRLAKRTGCATIIRRARRWSPSSAWRSIRSSPTTCFATMVRVRVRRTVSSTASASRTTTARQSATCIRYRAVRTTSVSWTTVRRRAAGMRSRRWADVRRRSRSATITALG